MTKKLSKSGVSCIIPTYNRCPNQERTELNPLWWASVSLMNQPNVKEIIIIDDASEDFTKETFDKINKVSKINVVYTKNDKRCGSGKSRNLGVEIASYDKIWFMDDDCVIINPEVLSKLQYGFDSLQKGGRKVGAITLPVSGDSLENKLTPKSEIGRVDRNKGVMLGCYTKFPNEYFNDLENFYLNKDKEIFKPLKVDLMGGVFLSSKKAFQEAKGFPTTRWRNACAEEPILILNMQKQGYETFYLPSLDPKFRVFHCRYGDARFKRIPFDMNVDGVSFNDILNESSNQRYNSGNRVSRKEEAYSNIISDMFVMFNFFGKEIGLNNLRTKYNLLERKEIFPQVENTIKIFQKAVREGSSLLMDTGKLDTKTRDYIFEEYINKNKD